MDEVLTHAMILDDGDTLFKKVDIPFEMNTEKPQDPKQLV
jgi:hypothetical protein